MDLKEYLDILSRRKWIVAITTLTSLAVMVVGTFLMTPTYQAASTLRVATAHQGSVDNVSYNTTYADRLASTYAKVITSAPMRDELAKSLGTVQPPSVKVDISPNTELLKISVEDSSPVFAANAANKMADLFLAYVRDTDNASDRSAQQALKDQLAQALIDVTDAQNQYDDLVAKQPINAQAIASAGRLLKVKEDTYSTLMGLLARAEATQNLGSGAVTIVEPASVPDSPSQPQKGLNIALGFLVGLMGGVGLAFVFENMDATLYTTEQIERTTELTVLGRIPSLKGRPGPILNGTSPAGEAFRHVRTSLLNLDHKSSLSTLLVTSAEPNEGKSTIATNLAYALAQSGKRTLLIDCDLRAPTLHKILKLDREPGLGNILAQGARLVDVMKPVPASEMWVLPSGQKLPNPAEALGSDGMTCLIQQAVQVFDHVVLDTPSLLTVTDGAVLAPKADAVVLVVARTRAKQNSVKAACRILEAAKVAKVGVVVNRTEAGSAYSYYALHRRS